jgi:hypothetical protein
MDTTRPHIPSTGELIEQDRAAGGERGRFEPPAAVPAEVLWRHGHWRNMRDKIRRAITATSNPYKRLARWDCCGACGVVEYSKSRNQHRATAWHCKDRLCRPCMRKSRRTIRQIIKNNVKGQRARFVTLTLDHREESLKEMMGRGKSAFGRLKRGKFWKTHCAGGICVPETKIGKDGRWHYHFHMVTTGRFMDQDELSKAWKKASRGAFIVDIKIVDDMDGQVAYITKYVTKLIDADMLDQEPQLIEFVSAMKGQRTWNVFGNWKADDTDAADTGENDWTPVCTVIELNKARDRGEEWAVTLHRALQLQIAGRPAQDTS